MRYNLVECKVDAMKHREHRVQSGETVLELYPGETLTGCRAVATGMVASFFVESSYPASQIQKRAVRVRLVNPSETPESGWKRLGAISANGHSYVAYQLDE